MKILIVAEHASLKYGGEAALPLHYFRVLRQRGIETWLVVHERTREELELLFEHDCDRFYFIKDTIWHRWLWGCSQFLPKRIADFTFGLILRLITQFSQRHLAKKIVRRHQIDVVHQPILVSPKEPSTMFDLGAPVVIGPLNGGMNYPPGFNRENRFVDLGVKFGRLFANLFNTLIPGKLRATTILVANQRTKSALPKGITGKIVEVVENGVDLSVWNRTEPSRHQNTIVRFVFLGRLVNWKGVDLLLKAFKYVGERVPVELEIIGDGKERSHLEKLAQELNLTKVNFTGFLPQTECAKRLESADVLVLPSLYECGGAVVLEAMTMAIPVIATDWGGPADYLDATCGILIKPKNPQSFILDLGNQMLELAQSPELRQSLGQAGQQKIYECFDWEIKVDTILDVYQDAINQLSALEKSEQYNQTNRQQLTINH